MSRGKLKKSRTTPRPGIVSGLTEFPTDSVMFLPDGRAGFESIKDGFKYTFAFEYHKLTNLHQEPITPDDENSSKLTDKETEDTPQEVIHR